MKNLSSYKIQNTEEDFIMPEETLMDNVSGHGVVEMSISQGVFRTVYALIFVLLAVLAVQAFRLQVVQGKRLAAIVEESQYHRYPVPSVRGKIFDRNGIVLADNTAAYDLVGYDNEKGVHVIKRDVPADTDVLPGQYLAPYVRRNYPLGSATAHVLGYTSQMTADELREYPDANINERKGRLGIEAQYDATLRGEPHTVILDSNIPQQPIRHGADLMLTINAKAQQRLYEITNQVFRSGGVKRGAAVVQNVNTGEVLAMVSLPTFDPGNITEKILQDKNHPLFNRTIGGLYAPGSTIKPLLAMAGLKEHVVDEHTKIFAEGAIQVQSEVDPSVYYTFRDWKVHGWTDIRKAIADSVDIFFYALGGGYEDIHGLGIDMMEKYLKLARADQPTGIDLPGEATGFVPSRAWKKETKNDAWYVGDSYNLSIGQGDLQVTPLWLNAYVSAIANGGKLMKPHLVKTEPEIAYTLPFSKATFDVVREGMRQAVTDGTAQLLNDLHVVVAAKTGTAQVTGRGLNSLFIVYGPYEDADIAMTILVENIPQSQSLAVKVADEFLIWYFK